MKIFHASKVSPGEEGDYYQVLFEEVSEGHGQYWLIQWTFEMPGDTYYVEDDALVMVGHYRSLVTELGRGHFSTEFGPGGCNSVQVTFDVSETEFLELARIIKIMLPDVHLAESTARSLRRRQKHRE